MPTSVSNPRRIIESSSCSNGRLQALLTASLLGTSGAFLATSPLMPFSSSSIAHITARYTVKFEETIQHLPLQTTLRPPQRRNHNPLGSGPGSPDLLTLSAYRILSDPSNLVIVDRLVSDEIVELIQGEVRIANKHPGCQESAQREIYEWCVQGLRDGRKVVRLKIGDPFVFGRGGEEVLEFRKFGVEPTVIPGVSAAFSAPLLANIPVTHRGISNQVVMCTGYGRNNTSPELIQYHKEQTVVFLMAVGRLRTLCENLVKMAGYPIETPVGIVERAGCPDQRVVVGTMETIADLAEEYDVKPPSTIVVGEVVNVLLGEEDLVGEVVLEGAVREGQQ
eukprot:g12685.t1 g12685   contig6:2417778-2419238(+)